MIDPWNARYIVLMLVFGGGTAIMYKSGGAYALTRALKNKLSSTKRIQLFTWMLGVLNFFNSDINAALVGSATKDVNREYRISTEKLSYILDSTASPVSTFGPVSDWIGYQTSLIAGVLTAVGVTGVNAYSIFLKSCPWNIYCAIVFLGVPMIIYGKPFGPMADAELRARKTGKLIKDGDIPMASVEAELGEPTRLEKATLASFVVPVISMLVVTVFGMWYTGGGPESASIIDAVNDCDVSIALTWGAFAMAFSGIILALRQGFTLGECEEILLKGFKSILTSLVIIVLSWALGNICDLLGTGPEVVNATKSWMSGAFIPAVIFILSAMISFATGTSWGTMAIVTPVGLTLAYQLGGIELLTITSGAIFSGSIFGDHCSPISDSTIMSCIFSGANLMAHTLSQVPIALTSAAIAITVYLLSTFLKSGVILLIAAIIIQYFVYNYLGERYQQKFSVEDRQILNQP